MDKKMEQFAYITFVNNHPTYLTLMQILIQSVVEFSKYKLFIYLVGVSNEIALSIFGDYYKYQKQINFKHVSNNLKFSSIYYYKPYIIIDALKTIIKSGYYIEADDILTPFCDRIVYEVDKLNEIPISPIHPDDVFIPRDQIDFMGKWITKTQHYVHGHVLFKDTNLHFIEEWFQACFKGTYRNADETALNILYWAYNCKNHYLPMIDPYFEEFYTKPENRENVYTYHGGKNEVEQQKLYNSMKEYYVSKKID